MKTLVLNGSPKGKNANSELFIHHFIKEMNSEVTVKRIIEEDAKELSDMVKKFDSLIIALPLYIHGMPGIVMRFIEHLNREYTSNKNLGFILQYGFPEGFQGDYIEQYFCSLAKELNMNYLGTLMKTDAAGVAVMPAFMTKKLFKTLNEFGRIYDEQVVFDNDIINKLKQPYTISKSKYRFFRIIKKIGLMDIFWNKFLKENKAYHHRFSQPFKKTSI